MSSKPKVLTATLRGRSVSTGINYKYEYRLNLPAWLEEMHKG